MQRPLYAIAFLAAALTSQAQTAAPTVRQVGTARLENVPEIPPQVSAAVQRYQNDRAAIFEDWLSDGSMLIVTRFGASHQIHRVAAPGGARTQLTFSSEPVAAAFAIPKTERFAFMRDNGGDEWFQLYATGLTGEPTLLTEPGTRNEAPVFSDDGKLALWSLAYVSNEDGYSRVVVRDLATRRALSQPETPSGVVTGMRFSPDGSQLAISLSGAKIAGDVWSWSVADGKLTRWTTSELGGLDPAKLAEPQLMRFTSFDGMSIPAFVYRPVNVVADTRTPVIIDIHGGPEGQTRPSWNVGAQYFAATLGATVILPNVRGSDGYGQRYMDLDNAQKREDSVKDIGALLDWIAEQAGLDRNRVAVYGQSYGGYMSLAVMTHHADRLVGGVERYGISDFVSFLKNTESYRRDNRRTEYGDERDPKMLEVFKRIAPLANVARITKPMLVMQGVNDPRVPKSESDQVVAGIRSNGVETWYVVFADEGHGFLKKHNNDLRREVETVFLSKLFAQSPVSAE